MYGYQTWSEEQLMQAKMMVTSIEVKCGVTGPAGSGHRKRNIQLNGFVGVGRTHRTTMLDNNLRE